jgi:hypothetical protein
MNTDLFSFLCHGIKRMNTDLFSFLCHGKTRMNTDSFRVVPCCSVASIFSVLFRGSIVIAFHVFNSAAATNSAFQSRASNGTCSRRAFHRQSALRSCWKSALLSPEVSLRLLLSGQIGRPVEGRPSRISSDHPLVSEGTLAIFSFRTIERIIE